MAIAGPAKPAGPASRSRHRRTMIPNGGGVPAMRTHDRRVAEDAASEAFTGQLTATGVPAGPARNVRVAPAPAPGAAEDAAPGDRPGDNRGQDAVPGQHVVGWDCGLGAERPDD